MDRGRRERRTAELGAPEDLSDLELDAAERAAELAYAHRNGNGNGNGASHWTGEDLARLRKLLALGDRASWSVGDHVLGLVPMGETKAANGAFAQLRRLAELAGCEFVTLRRARAVSSAWPPPTRVHGIAMSAHAAYTSGGPDAAAERAELLRLLAGEHRHVTADLVREHRGLKRCRELRDPIRSLAGRIDRAHALLEMLPDGPTRHTPAATLRRRAQQARDIADALERLAA